MGDDTFALKYWWLKWWRCHPWHFCFWNVGDTNDDGEAIDLAFAFQRLVTQMMTMPSMAHTTFRWMAPARQGACALRRSFSESWAESGVHRQFERRRRHGRRSWVFCLGRRVALGISLAFFESSEKWPDFQPRERESECLQWSFCCLFVCWQTICNKQGWVSGRREVR